MAISKEEVIYIDNYLKFLGVKYMDIRLEILDHLASEFENIQEPTSLGDFLRTKRSFVKRYENQWQKAKHWAHQRALIKRIIGYFYKPNQLFIPICIGIFFGFNATLLPKSLIAISFCISLIVPQCIHFYIYYKPEGIYKNIQSAKYILSIMALPSIFMYLMGIMAPIIKESPTVFYAYWFFAMVFNIAGLQEVMTLKRQIVKTYSKLISN
ncbi:hypothetical protein [Maribacter flavus]|uniref:Uncharacterized protein n=1 Tax=Maribacter flavus TaxID=1658664 RepID=A0A5B2TZE3_9FLAO|nr:hypothetical protein [Maribacter flavus]KAA2219225.1 hypothetical protein F0361_06335 [Maribacter flavus]